VPGEGGGLRLAIGGAPRNISVSGGFRISSITGGVFDAFSVVMSNANGGLWVLEVEIGSDRKLELVEYDLETASTTRAASSIDVPFGAWIRLTLDLTVGTPSHAVLKIDKDLAVQKDLDTTANTGFAHVDFGDVQADQGLAWQVRMDDLTATY
jgi:hypothetical protein